MKDWHEEGSLCIYNPSKYINSNKRFNKSQAINSPGRVLCPLKTELLHFPHFILWQMPNTQKEDFSDGMWNWCIWLLLKQVVSHFQPVPALWGKLSSVIFTLLFFEIGSKKRVACSLSCKTFCGTVVTKDAIQLPVGKSEGYIYSSLCT